MTYPISALQTRLSRVEAEVSKLRRLPALSNQVAINEDFVQRFNLDGGNLGDVLVNPGDPNVKITWDAQSGTGGGNDFPALDLVDENDPTYFYFGWASYSGGWYIRRQDRLSGGVLDAAPINNTLPADLATAWTDRTTLTYGVL